MCFYLKQFLTNKLSFRSEQHIHCTLTYKIVIELGVRVHVTNWLMYSCLSNRICRIDRTGSLSAVCNLADQVDHVYNTWSPRGAFHDKPLLQICIKIEISDLSPLTMTTGPFSLASTLFPRATAPSHQGPCIPCHLMNRQSLLQVRCIIILSFEPHHVNFFQA